MVGFVSIVSDTLRIFRATTTLVSAPAALEKFVSLACAFEPTLVVKRPRPATASPQKSVLVSTRGWLAAHSPSNTRSTTLK